MFIGVVELALLASGLAVAGLWPTDSSAIFCASVLSLSIGVLQLAPSHSARLRTPEDLALLGRGQRHPVPNCSEAEAASAMLGSAARLACDLLITVIRIRIWVAVAAIAVPTGRSHCRKRRRMRCLTRQ